MTTGRPYTEVLSRLRAAGLRPTRQRLALAKLLFEQGHRHVSAESLHDEVLAAGQRVSLATIYNTLHQFTRAGLLREVAVEPGKAQFDTNVSDHHHFFFEASGELRDVPGSAVQLSALPSPPSGTAVSRVDVIIRVAPVKD
jgi:Fur family iron response transcriptional regulator